jgi:hypothetical protein
MRWMASAWLIVHSDSPSSSARAGDAVAGVAAGLQVAAQVGMAEPAGLLLQASGAPVVDYEPALDDQSAGRFRWSLGYPCFVVPGAPPPRETHHHQGISRDGPAAIW